MATHYGSCRLCKVRIGELLGELFGHVQKSRDLGLPATIEGWKDTAVGEALSVIYEAMQKHRGYEHFVRRQKLRPVDYFVPSCGLIVEFDESQHFTRPREISLGYYPKGLQVGFPVERWRSLCKELDRHDIDPPYRDEQRAWLDTLRDFAPTRLGLRPIIRLYYRDHTWCNLSARREADLQFFKQILDGRGTASNAE